MLGEDDVGKSQQVLITLSGCQVVGLSSPGSVGMILGRRYLGGISAEVTGMASVMLFSEGGNCKSQNGHHILPSNGCHYELFIYPSIVHSLWSIVSIGPGGRFCLHEPPYPVAGTSRRRAYTPHTCRLYMHCTHMVVSLCSTTIPHKCPAFSHACAHGFSIDLLVRRPSM